MCAWLLVACGRFGNTQSADELQKPQTFDSPEQAADAVIDAAAKFDVSGLIDILGSDGEDVITSGDYVQDRQLIMAFAAQAHEQRSLSPEPRSARRVFLLVGKGDWPFPIPIVKTGSKWTFDVVAGRQEIFYRRIGSNELDAIDVCHGFVDAQYDFAYRKREEYAVNQYAQRVISSPGQRDGLAWQNADGTWGGPIGEKIALAINQGYAMNGEPYHGYFFKVLKGQGPDAPLGTLDYIVHGIMIGGFALIAAPAEYGETGVNTFMVSQDGVVYQKDLGPDTLEEFNKIERFNPDDSWTPVSDN
jgi:hypothetical protein